MKSMADLMKPRKTVDDILNLPEGTRAELIHGEITIMTPSPFLEHQKISARLCNALSRHCDGHACGEVLPAPMDVHLPSGDVVQPDLIFVAKERQSILQKWVHGSPDLLIEILSPSSVDRDRFVKRDLYAQNGVGEYWIVDPDEKTIEVFTLAGGAYVPAGYFKVGQTLLSPTLVGFALATSDVFGAR